ncbi:hypothetical protein [Coprobacter sp.]
MEDYYKNIGIHIKIRENLTDPRFVKFIKEWDFTEDKISEFFKSIWEDAYNEYSAKIIKFFVEYKDGVIIPDKCGITDPVKEKFDKSNISVPVAWLSYPGTKMILEKKRKYKAVIKCEYWKNLTNGGEILNPKKIFPKYMGIITSMCITSKEQTTCHLPEYMSIITFWFNKQRKIDMDFLKQLLKDFCEYLNTDYGVIFDQETYEVIFDPFERSNET